MTSVTGDWLTSKGAQAVLSMFENAGYCAYAVGGCVRNALLGVAVSDVDMSTNARPEKVIELAKLAGLRSVPTGIDHGTITVVANGEGYEVTTFRADIETDGRRAVVKFADDIAQDAIRRDFTMNALYADRRGNVLDPLGGLADLRARHLRFIEDADRRIREDYLRILRFFRFFAWYGDPETGMDAEAISAIASNLDGLTRLSRERVGAEVIKLLSAADPGMAVAVMQQTGVLAKILPGAVPRALGPLIMHEQTLSLAPNALRRLAVVGFSDGVSLRLSKSQQRQLAQYQSLIVSTEAPKAMAHRYGVQTAIEALALQAASYEHPLNVPDLPGLQAAASAQFPITAADLMPQISGAALGQTLKRLEDIWIASDFSLDKAALMALRAEG